MADNRLESLPSPIDELAALKWLDVSKNDLASLPQGFTQLHLDFLEVGNNRLCFGKTAEPDSAMAELSQWLDGTDRDWRTTQTCP
jgi:Leucine-rich repeat (LRR) protein